MAKKRDTLSTRKRRAEIVRVACAYTKRERADEDIAGPEMVQLWLRLCSLCRAERGAKEARGRTRKALAAARALLERRGETHDAQR